MIARFAAIAAALVAAFALTASANAATVVNGGFEAGLTGWNQAIFSAESGSWVAYAGNRPLPQSGDFVIAPFAGSGAVSSDEFENSSSSLYQDVSLEAGFTHKFEYKHGWNNEADNWFTPEPMNFALGAVEFNQQLRVDVIKPSADPRTTNASDILATSFQTDPTTPLVAEWTDGPALDLSSFAGQTVRLRFIYVADESYLHHVIDEVKITSTNIKPATVTAAKISTTKLTEKKSTSVSFASDEPGSATLTLEKSSSGKRVGKKCVRPSRKNRSKRGCTRWVALKGSQTSAVVAGTNKLTVTATKKLKPGKYRLKLVVTDNGGLASAPTYKTFTVVAKKKKR